MIYMSVRFGLRMDRQEILEMGLGKFLSIEFLSASARDASYAINYMCIRVVSGMNVQEMDNAVLLFCSIPSHPRWTSGLAVQYGC